MRAILTAISACALAGSVLVFADEASVNFDPSVDFSTFKTFALREGTVESPKPELDNVLFVKNVWAVIRASLVAKRLTETATSPDLVIDFRIRSEDISTTQRGGGDARMRVPSSGPQSVRFTQATLVVDMLRGGATSIWRGTYRDDEFTGAKLVQKLPEDAKKLLAKYPPPKPKR